MSANTDKHIEGFIKQCIEEALGVNKKATKTEIPFRKLTDIDKKDTEDFDTVLEFVVNSKTGQAGLLINHTVLESWNKNLSEVLLDNIEASLLLLKEDLK